MALGVGIATTIGGRNANENSFGLIAMCSIGPIVAVMALSLTANGEMPPEILENLAAYATVDGSLKELGHILLSNLQNVGIALGLVVVFFFILQFTVLKLPKN